MSWRAAPTPKLNRTVYFGAEPAVAIRCAGNLGGARRAAVERNQPDVPRIEKVAG